MKINREAFGVLFIRLLLGVILFMQGYGKIFTFGLESVQGFFTPYKEMLPSFLVDLTFYFTTFGEFIFGITIALGLFRNVSYLSVALILILVSFGHGLQDVIWDMQHVIYRAALLIPLFFISVDKDKFALDNLLFKKNWPEGRFVVVFMTLS